MKQTNKQKETQKYLSSREGKQLFKLLTPQNNYLSKQ